MKASKVELYIDGVLHSSHPIYSDKISIDKERESGEMYRRTKLNSTFTFVREDFDLIYGSPIDTSFEVRVKDSETDTLLARGTFEKTDCKFNVDDGICEVKATSADEYDKILAGMDDEYDLVSLAPVREKVGLTKRAILQVYFSGDNKVTNIIGNMSYEIDINPSIDVSNITQSQLEDDYDFHPILGSSFIINLNEAVSASIPQAKGIYEFTSEVSVTTRRFTNENGYYIDLEAGIGFMSGYLYKNGSKVQYTGKDIVVTLNPVAEGDDPDINVVRLESGGALTTVIGRVVNFLNGIYARILIDQTTNYLGDDINEIPEVDLCASNLNYRYSTSDVDDDLQLRDYLVYSFDVQDEPTKWGVDGDGKYYVQPTPMGIGDNVIPIGWSRWIPASFWFNSTEGLADILDTFDTPWTLRDAYPLWSAIKVLLAKIDPTISFNGDSSHSEFLYGNISPSVIYGWIKQYLYITPITNVKRTYYNQAARKGKITLGQILTMLRTACQLYWFVDEEKRLRIEHITWFKNGGNYASLSPIIDLTSVVSPMSRKDWSFGQNTFEYDKSQLPKRYEFSWNEQCTEAFDGFPIDIKNKYVGNGSTERSQAANFVSDVDLIMSAPDALSDDSFAVIGTGENKKCPIMPIGNYGMDFIAPTYKMQNPYLSFYFLELSYWLYNLSGNYATTPSYKRSNGDDGNVRVFKTKRAKTQSVRFPLDVDKVGDEGLVTTRIGDGEWVKSKYTVEDGMTDMSLVMDVLEPPLVDYALFHRLKAMTLGVDYEANRMQFTIDGGKYHINDWGYVLITANEDVKITMDISSEGSNGIGWADPSAITSRTAAFDAEHNVWGTMNRTFTLAKGESIYIGYVKQEPLVRKGSFSNAFSNAFEKDSATIVYEDKIIFDIVRN